MNNSKMLEVAVVEQTMQSTQGCEGLLRSKVVPPLQKTPNTWGIQQTKRMLE